MSLSDIISFESQQALATLAPAADDKKAELIVERATRVLTEARSVLEVDVASEQGAGPKGQQAGNRLAPGEVSSITSAAPIRLTAEELSRAIFGISAQESERQGAATRQALQSALEGGGGGSQAAASDGKPPDRWAALGRQANGISSDQEEGFAEGKADDSVGGSGVNPERPSWAQALFREANGGGGGGASSSSAGPQRQPAASARKQQLQWAPLAFAEVDSAVPTVLTLKSEESLFADKARKAVLPPLQSVLDLTGAVAPPQRGGASAAQQQMSTEASAVAEGQAVQGSGLGRKLADGTGRLADGTRFEKLSGVDRGENGYVKQWEVLRGITGDGTVSWEECWWQASDRFGLKELGAFKKGTDAEGGAWREEWKEVMYTHPVNMRAAIERSAHKWARDPAGDEWEEKWGEHYEEAGRVHKWADKWAKQDNNVWHERWGEDYDGQGACQKWTDKWAERLLPGGASEQWGDKWTETFGWGKGTKHGEVWSAQGDGHRYNRWWNEEHYGDGRVRKWGNSTGGEYWDAVEHMDTYYNPIPHFGFKLAASHSPNLWAVPLPPPDETNGQGGDDDDGLGVGLGRL